MQLSGRLAIATIAIFGFVESFSQLLETYGDENRIFTAGVYKEVSRQEPGNFLICPLSVSMVMGLTSLGAQGDTLAEISRGLRLPSNPAQTQQLFQELLPQLRGNDRYSLNAANKIYTKEGFKINSTYQQLAENSFGAGIENVDFAKAKEAATKINTWVEQQTNNKIHELITEDLIGPSTRMILVNAMHFKGKWKKPFDSFDTIKRPFHGFAGNQHSVDMMQITDFFNYYESPELDCKFLEIPYEGGELSMVLVLPNTIEGLRALETQADKIFMKQPFEKQNIRVQIPKFTMETKIQFKPILQKLGVEKVFSPDADLNGIGVDERNLFVDKVVQKTFINVTEKGTEAAAATAGGVVTLSIPTSWLVKLEFKADHPFLFFIQFINQKHAPAILFSGRFTTPKAPLTFEHLVNHAERFAIRQPEILSRHFYRHH